MVYRANMKFEHADNWVLRVWVDSPTAGSADFETPLVVLPPPIESDASGGWVFLGVFAVLAAGSGVSGCGRRGGRRLGGEILTQRRRLAQRDAEGISFVAKGGRWESFGLMTVRMFKTSFCQNLGLVLR